MSVSPQNTIPNIISAGQLIDAGPVENDFEAIRDAHNTHTHSEYLQTPLNTSENALAADVTIVNANTYYDGPSVSLGAGTWLLVGHVTIEDATNDGTQYAKLWDGTTAYASGEADSRITAVSITLQAIVTPASTTTYKISCASSHGTSNAKIKAAMAANGAGNNASKLTAIKIG